jgi:hypothetical protein
MHVKLGGFVTGSQSYVRTYAQLPGAAGAIRLAVRNYLMTGNSEEKVPIVSVRLCESP